MTSTPPLNRSLEAARAFYRRVMEHLLRDGAPFLVGGAYALAYYTGIHRQTKDLDLFVAPEDAREVYRSLHRAGCRIEVFARHWLAKATEGEEFVDLIHSSGNGVARVDERWFAEADEGEVLGVRVPLCPAEEMIWSKSFIMERERYDGADIAHLLHERADALDWERLLERFGEHWRVLLSHLVLFGFIYPARRTTVPEWLMAELLRRLRKEQATPAPPDATCRGTLLSRVQYLVDIDEGYCDGRLPPNGTMRASEIAAWTERAQQEGAVPERVGGDRE